MSGTVPAEEIADDYRYSLESLQSPDRYAINNLTVIAKENTEHADAISNVLVEHIKKAPPHHKLPALYVLDSIAKNIGTPYTLFLGHKLYNTFMGAYSSVDPSTRRKMDEMLKTWKSPVPGAIDPRPVFPMEITKKIESALTQARTAAMRHEHANPLALAQKRPGSAVGAPQWRNTPTPPQVGMQYPPPQPPQPPQYAQQPPPQGYIQPPMPFSTHSPAPHTLYQQHNGALTYGAYQHPHSTLSMQVPHHQGIYQHPLPYAQSQPLSPDLALLNRDIEQLISTSRQEFSVNAGNNQKMTKLNALLQLQTVINSQQLPADQLQNVRRQVDDLQAAHHRDQLERVAPQPTAPTPLQNFLSQVPQPPPAAAPIVPNDLYPTSTQMTMNQKPAGTDLASLLAGFNQPAQQSPPCPPPIGQPAVVDYSSLLSSLSRSGVVGNSAGTPPTRDVPATEQQAPNSALQTTSNMPLASLLALAGMKAPLPVGKGVELSSASLKKSRPQLIKDFLAQRPNKCVTCGRRFPATEDGKAKKMKHMDWHFRTNQRIQDASKPIQNRSWYIGELEWIKSKDTGAEDGNDTMDSNAQTEATIGQGTAKENYVSVPSDPDASQPCPICQEKFETGFSQEIEDWVWLDAIQVGNRIYHASCFADVRRGGGMEAKERTATPDSVLGKRKAEAAITDVSPVKKIAS